MKYKIFVSGYLFLLTAVCAFAQLPPRDMNQIRNETSERNKIVNDPANNPFPQNSNIASGRMLNSRRIPDAAVRSYVLAAQASTIVKVVAVKDGDTLLVDDGKNKVVVRILGIDAPEEGQSGYEEAKKNLSDLLFEKKVLIVYSLNNLKDAAGYFPAQVFVGAEKENAALNQLTKGLAWRNTEDKFYVAKKDAAELEKTEVAARTAQIGIWQEKKPLSPRKFRERKLVEMKKAKKKFAKI